MPCCATNFGPNIANTKPVCEPSLAMTRDQPDKEFEVAPLYAHDFDLAETEAGPETPAERRLVWQLLTIAILLGITIFVSVARRGEPTPSAIETTSASPTVKTAQEPAQPPRVLADDPAGRRAAQDLLAQAVKLLTAMEKRSDGWARTALHQLQAELAAGEQAYREKRYAEAQKKYRVVLSGIDALEAEIPARASAYLDAGHLALASGDSAAATAAFTAAQKLDGANLAAQRGLARAATLDQVSALTAQAESYERMRDVDNARATYQAALALDTDAPEPHSALARLERSQRDARFKDAMSAGYAALAKQDFARARASFAEAGAIDSNAADLEAALEQFANAELAYGIETHMNLARRAVAGERWRIAISEFDKALKLDGGLTEAETTRGEARLRLRLDDALVAMLARKEQFSVEQEYAQAVLLSAKAKTIGAGQRLGAQIKELDTALRLARTPVATTLHSDGETQVEIESLGKLGTLSQRTVEILPGRHVAIGRRDGYRDVRVEFSISPGAPGPALTILCNEPIAP